MPERGGSGRGFSVLDFCRKHCCAIWQPALKGPAQHVAIKVWIQKPHFIFRKLCTHKMFVDNWLFLTTDLFIYVCKTMCVKPERFNQTGVPTHSPGNKSQRQAVVECFTKHFSSKAPDRGKVWKSSEQNRERVTKWWSTGDGRNRNALAALFHTGEVIGPLGTGEVEEVRTPGGLVENWANRTSLWHQTLLL